MESFIFAIIALLIMIPIMYFLPLGFSRRGRAVIIGAALIISLMVQLTTSIMSIGQALLIAILLIGSVGYFLTKKIDMFLPPATAEELEAVPNSVGLADSSPSYDSFSYIALSDKGMKEIDEYTDQVHNDDLKKVSASTLNLFLGNRDMMDRELANFQYSEVASTTASVGDLDESNTGDQVDNTTLVVKEDQNAENEAFDLTEENLEEDEIAELSVKPTISEVEDELFEESDLESLVDEIDELPEIDFEARGQDQSHSKKEENDLDEDFWTSLLEEEELDVIEEKKDKSYTK